MLLILLFCRHSVVMAILVNAIPHATQGTDPTAVFQAFSVDRILTMEGNLITEMRRLWRNISKRCSQPTAARPYCAIFLGFFEAGLQGDLEDRMIGKSSGTVQTSRRCSDQVGENPRYNQAIAYGLLHVLLQTAIR